VGENKFYRILYANVLYFVVMLGGPLVILAFLNSRLIIALKAQDRKRKLMSGNGRKCVVSTTAAAANVRMNNILRLPLRSSFLAVNCFLWSKRPAVTDTL
jgi:hypothetical protein